MSYIMVFAGLPSDVVADAHFREYDECVSESLLSNTNQHLTVSLHRNCLTMFMRNCDIFLVTS